MGPEVGRWHHDSVDSSMEPTLVTIRQRTLMGMRLRTTLANHTGGIVWRDFRSRIDEIPTRIGTDWFAVQDYPRTFGSDTFTIHTPFFTWATVEVSEDTDNVPPEIEIRILAGGLYAVFEHQGSPDDFPQLAHRMYNQWLPESGFLLDVSRSHFEILPHDYHPLSPTATETVWIPLVGIG